MPATRMRWPSCKAKRWAIPFNYSDYSKTALFDISSDVSIDLGCSYPFIFSEGNWKLSRIITWMFSESLNNELFFTQEGDISCSLFSDRMKINNPHILVREWLSMYPCVIWDCFQPEKGLTMYLERPFQMDFIQVKGLPWWWPKVFCHRMARCPDRDKIEAAW